MDVGQTIRDGREAQKITREALFEKTRIPVSTIEKIENNEVDDLPRPYYLAFVRTLASEVGCDADALILHIEQIAEPDDIEEEISDESLAMVPAIKTFWQTHKSWLPAAIILLCVVCLIGLYIQFGKPLFSDPQVPGGEHALTLSDSTGFSFYVIGLEKSTLYATPDTGIRQTVELQSNEKYSWACRDSILLEMEDPMAVALYLNQSEVPVFVQDTTAIVYVLITKEGIQRFEEKKPIKPVPKEEPKPEKKEEAPVILLGHVDVSELLDKCPLSADAKRKYKADPAVVSKIVDYNPSLSLLFFIGTWDPASQKLAGQMLALLNQLNLNDLSLTFIGVDENLKDRAGLVDFHSVQGVPTVLFLSRGNELGRMAGQSGETIEKQFLNVVEMLEMIRVSQPAEPKAEDEAF